jgi:hypothetical protein
MNEKTIKALVDAGAVKKVMIVADARLQEVFL